MKLEIIVCRTNEAILEEAANDPANEGLSDEAVAWNAGYNHQSCFTLEVEKGETFQIEEGQEGTIEGFTLDSKEEPEHDLEGAYQKGATLESGQYRFDGDQVIRFPAEENPN